MNDSNLVQSFYKHEKPDILDCLTILGEDIGTPPDTVNKILDLLPKNTWTNKNLSFCGW